jgi:membrane associated rhomboid family serine protease
MARRTASEFGLPPFVGAVRQIILTCIAIYVFILLALTFAPAVGNKVLELGVLNPSAVRHGWIWQFVTYPFMSVDPWQFVVTVAGVYFIGPAVEASIGRRRFWSFFLGTSILAGVAGFILSLSGVVAQGSAFGVGAAANAILMVFYLYHRNAPIMAFFLIQVPIKWLVIFFAALEAAYMLLTHFSLYYVMLLLGLGAGYVWYRLVLARPSAVGLSEKYFSFRNSYYRWKRRRAARKFEVYMRSHNQSVQFDEHGNYIPPDESGKKTNGGSKSGWVN